MKKSDKLAINVPFMGFYYSLYDQQLDWEMEQEADRLAEESGLTVGVINDIFYRRTDFGEAHVEVAKKYLDAINDFMEEETGLNPQIEWDEMTSPKEYNFETDRIFGKITGAKLKELLTACDKEELNRLIGERFTSRSGFISFYPNTLDAWIKKPISRWDHNQLGTVLLCVLERIEDWENKVFEETQRGDVFSTAFSNCVDWAAVDADIAELKAGNHDE